MVAPDYSDSHPRPFGLASGISGSKAAFSAAAFMLFFLRSLKRSLSAHSLLRRSCKAERISEPRSQSVLRASRLSRYAKRLVAHATFHGNLWRPFTLSMSVRSEEAATVT